MNKPNNPSTFATTRGESNIDITLVSSRLERFIKDWKVNTVYTTSDHNLITFSIVNATTIKNKWTTQDGYNIKNANWET